MFVRYGSKVLTFKAFTIMANEPKWQDVEALVRVIAQAKFSGTARPEDIAGVKCDCVIHLNDGSVVLIEITKENTIDKLRQDLNKFNTLRPYFFQQNIFPKCYFITFDEPTPSLIESGRVNHVQVLSVNQFINLGVGLINYVIERKKYPFGSAIDLYTGEPDENKYVEVNYFTDHGENYTTEKIASELISGKSIVLIGDYGAGKSRCVKEVFSKLVERRKVNIKLPIAINLRENWGLKRSSEILTRHFTDLGLGERVPDILRIAHSSSLIYLLDGFDEVGAQTWSDETTKLIEIRKKSLVGVKDLIQQSKGGIFICGREHYFNNDVELINCLGLENKNVTFLRCNHELNDQQFSELIGRDAGPLPKWLPKKPLIGTVIRSIEADLVEKILSSDAGQLDFWDLLLTTFCEREARINPILDAAIIRALYSQIGRLARTTKTTLGPITIKAINDAFEKVTGGPPTDESAIILQRLPGLGRIGAESLDRQFVDTYILDGLKAEDVFQIYSEYSTESLSQEWRHPVEDFGVFFLTTKIRNARQKQGVPAFLIKNINSNNRVLLSDLISGIFYCEGLSADLAGINICSGKFNHLVFSDCQISNINFNDCTFDYIDFAEADINNINIVDSIIYKASGISSVEHSPSWLENCLIENIQSVSTLTAIRDAGLNLAQTFLLSSLRKLFLQPGSGRKESSLFKGYSNATAKKTCEKVIHILVKEKFCQKIKGTTEDLYLPDRSLTGRVKAIMSRMTLSRDPIWTEVSKIR